MNRENIQWTIDLLKAVPDDALLMTYWYTHRFNANTRISEMKTMIDQLPKPEGKVVDTKRPEIVHQCGNAACVYGHMALQPYFNDYPDPHEYKANCDRVEAAADFWELPHWLTHSIIQGPTHHYAASISAVTKTKWNEWKPADVISVLQAILNGELVP